MRIEPQFVGERGRQIADLGALERRAAFITISSRGVSGAVCKATEAVEILAAALNADLRGAAERPGAEAVVEGIGIVDRLAVDRDDQIAAS